jgi:hypothetical protein
MYMLSEEGTFEEVMGVDYDFLKCSFF